MLTKMNTLINNDQTFRVLFCDDVGTIRHVMVRQLERAFVELGMDNVEVTAIGSTPDEVRSLVNIVHGKMTDIEGVISQGPAYDIVVCDQNMGTLDDNGNDFLGSDIAQILHDDTLWKGPFVLQTASPPDIMSKLSENTAINLLLNKEKGFKYNADAVAHLCIEWRRSRI